MFGPYIRHTVIYGAGVKFEKKVAPYSPESTVFILLSLIVSITRVSHTKHAAHFNPIPIPIEKKLLII